MRPPRVLAVDVGAGRVACGVFSTGATGRLVLQQFAREAHPSDPAHEGRWANEVAQSLGAIVARQKFGGPAALVVPGHLALTKFVKIPTVAPEKRRKIVAFEAAENIPHPLGEVVWDFLVLGDDGFDLDVMLSAVKTDAMQTLCNATAAAGFTVERAVPAGLALYHGFRYNHPEVRDPVLVANIGARSAHLLFIDGPKFYLRTIPLGGNAVTQAIAEDLRLDFAQAEALKVAVLAGRSDLPATSAPRLAVQRASAAFLGRLHLEITRSTLNHRRVAGGPGPALIYVAGGGSLIAELPATLAEKLKLPVERYDALRNVDLSGDARASGADTAGAELADLVGLATRLVVKDEQEVSLLPPAAVEAIALRRRQPWLAAAAVMAVAALVPPIVYLHGRVEAQRAELTTLDDQLRPLRSLQARNDENLRQIEEAKQRIAALRSAYETKANWINFFTDLQSRLVKVEDVWLDKLQIVRAASTGENPVAATPPEGATGGENSAAPSAPPVRLTLSGRLLDVANPTSRVSPASLDRVKQLLTSFTQSQFIASVENEHFDNSQNGLLKFDFTLVLKSEKPL